jgi:predicted acylesterase/phospholipase RssA
MTHIQTGNQIMTQITVIEAEPEKQNEALSPMADPGRKAGYRASSAQVRPGSVKTRGSVKRELERAIAAGTAAPCVWPPITIESERHIDGRVRGMPNADLAIGSDALCGLSIVLYVDIILPAETLVDLLGSATVL